MKALFPIIPRAKMWIGVGILIMIAGFALFFANQRYSIQFTGGIEMVLDAQNIDASVSDSVKDSLVKAGFTPERISVGEKDNYPALLVQIPLDDDKKVQIVTETLQKTLTEKGVIDSPEKILEQSVIGPSIGEYMKKSASTAIIAGVILMAIYILISFREMRHLVSPLLLAVITILTMIFDIAFPAGMYGLWMQANSAIQIDAIFIVALLTIMGYSINDTIIIFDRVRENFLTHEKQFEKGGEHVITELYESSLRQTMKRSLGTSFTTFLVCVIMYFLGTGALKTFAFTFGMGVISGSFSSIFFAAPLAYLFSKITLGEKKK